MNLLNIWFFRKDGRICGYFAVVSASRIEIDFFEMNLFFIRMFPLLVGDGDCRTKNGFETKCNETKFLFYLNFKEGFESIHINSYLSYNSQLSQRRVYVNYISIRYIFKNATFNKWMRKRKHTKIYCDVYQKVSFFFWFGCQFCQLMDLR